MSRFVKISLVAPPTIQANAPDDLEASVMQMQEFWGAELRPVLCNHPDLIVLPEACDRYTNMDHAQRDAYYRVRGTCMLDFFSDIAKMHHCYIAYSAARELMDGTWRNSTTMIGRDGKIVGIYNKNHLVVEETTIHGILCGQDVPVFQCDFGRVCCAICFDLNFTPALEKTIAAKPDLVVFSSMYHGGLMQPYWAYACRAHFAAAIRGEESAILNPLGEVLAKTSNYFHNITHTINLDCTLAHLDYNWQRFAAAKDKYGDDLTIFDPGYVGAVLLTCNRSDMTAQDMVKEFEIELLDDYFVRALAHREANLESSRSADQLCDFRN